MNLNEATVIHNVDVATDFHSVDEATDLQVRFGAEHVD
jgi:hypothetical protein